MFYKDRKDAGRQLAEKLKKYKEDKPIIMALPRGGVVLGYEVAKILNAPMDVITTRKTGAPFNPEFGIGAIAPNGIRILNPESINLLKISDSEIERIIEKETNEMNRRITLYRKGLPSINLQGKTVIVVDDGLATGVSTKAAILSIKQMQPEKIILAVPVSPPNTADKFRKEVDEFICLAEPADFYAVSVYYDNFEQISDEEVINLIQKAKQDINLNN